MSIACTYRGVGYGFELPPGYRECEYLESTGTQYIDTGHYATHLSGVHIRYAYLRKGRPEVFGGRKDGSYSWGNEAFALIDTDNSGGIGDRIFVAQNRVSVNSGLAGVAVQNHIYDVRVNVDADQKIYIDDKYYVQGSTTATFTQPVATLMFAGRQNYTSLGIGTVAIYSCTIYDNTVPIMNFAPCLDVNSVPCMYDTIGRKPYYNVGTGEFNYKVKSDHFPIGYTELEYLESTGTQWLDTKVDIRSIGEWTLVANFINLDGIQINGCYTSDSPALAMDIGIAYSGHWFMRNGGPGDNQDTPADTEVHEFIVSQTDKATYIDGVLFSDSSLYKDLSGSRSDFSIFLFNRNNTNNDHKYWCYEKIYSSTMRDRDGVLIQNLVPYLDPYGTPCMVDILTGKPYYNAGTGTFKYKLK